MGNASWRALRRPGEDASSQMGKKAGSGPKSSILYIRLLVTVIRTLYDVILTLDKQALNRPNP